LHFGFSGCARVRLHAHCMMHDDASRFYIACSYACGIVVLPTRKNRRVALSRRACSSRVRDVRIFVT
jgi:hypothetical protein